MPTTLHRYTHNMYMHFLLDLLFQQKAAIEYLKHTFHSIPTKLIMQSYTRVNASKKKRASRHNGGEAKQRAESLEGEKLTSLIAPAHPPLYAGCRSACPEAGFSGGGGLVYTPGKVKETAATAAAEMMN